MWLNEILELFGSTLDALFGIPALGFFLVLPLFLALWAVLAGLIRRGGGGRL